MSQLKQDTANLLRQQSETMRVLCELGFALDDVVEAVTSGDLSSLVKKKTRPAIGSEKRL